MGGGGWRWVEVGGGGWRWVHACMYKKEMDFLNKINSYVNA